MSRFVLLVCCLLLPALPLMAQDTSPAVSGVKETLARGVENAINQVQRGQSLAKSLSSENNQLFPPSVIEMITVAEETGRLDKELMRLSVAFEADLDRELRLLVSLAEPLMLFVMAGVIGTVVVGMLLPVFNMGDLMH